MNRIPDTIELAFSYIFFPLVPPYPGNYEKKILLFLLNYHEMSVLVQGIITVQQQPKNSKQTPPPPHNPHFFPAVFTSWLIHLIL